MGVPVTNDRVAVFPCAKVAGSVAAGKGAVVGEEEDRGIQYALVAVDDAQAKPVVFTVPGGGGEVDPQPQWGVRLQGCVTGVTDDGVRVEGQFENFVDELLGV